MSSSQNQNSDIFYFGGPLLGINDPSLRCNSEILTNSDGTRIAFSADPRPWASRSSGASLEAGGEGLVTGADLDHDLSDARNPFEDAETGHQDTGEASDGEAGGSVQADATTQQQADATAPQPSSPESSSGDDDGSPAQAPPSQGSTAVNATATPASTGQNQQATTGRTTGFNTSTGQGMLTEVCGVVCPAKGGKPKPAGGKQGKYRCPRCNGRFTRPRSVKDHFIKCVQKYGNPAGLNWFDHRTLAKSKEWHLSHMPEVKDEEDDEEEEGDEGDEEEGEEEAEGGEEVGEVGEVEAEEDMGDEEEADDQAEVEDMQWE